MSISVWSVDPHYIVQGERSCTCWPTRREINVLHSGEDGKSRVC